jgi:hypothetical protein
MPHQRYLRTSLLTGLILSLCGLMLAAPATRPATQPAVRPSTAPGAGVDIRETVTYLASDELEGRGAGTVGQEKAAQHIASVFKMLNLKTPPGWDDYFQTFPLTMSTTIDPKTSLSAGEGKKWTEAIDGGLKLNKDFQPLSFSAPGKFDAPIVFVGYAITAKHHNYDDFEGVDLKGKIALAFRFEPTDTEGKSLFTGKKDDWSANSAIPAKAELAAAHGAIALILVNPPTAKNDDISPFARMAQVPKATIPVVQIKQPVAEALLKSADAGRLVDLHDSIDKKGKPQSFELKGVTVTGDVVLNRKEAKMKNVAAVLPGNGPHADEYIVIGAHFDHLGRGGPGSLAINSREIHHGADDNASGTTAVLKLAEEMSKAGPLDHSVIFVTFSGEELGLIGSARFVANSPVPLGKIVAMLNLDMVGRVREGRLQVGGSGTAANFEKILNDAAEGAGLKLNLNSKGGMGPSDHTSFAVKRIPVLFFFSGMHMDYHRPTDTADKINVEGIEQVVTLVQRVARSIDKEPREQYVSKFDSQALSIMGSDVGSGGPRASLGVVPDYAEDESLKGVKISGTTGGSAAEKAGLKGGDIILGFGDKKIDNLTDLMGALLKSKPGDKVTLKVLRGKENIELQATLTERKG